MLTPVRDQVIKLTPAVCNSANAIYVGDTVKVISDGANSDGVLEVDVGADGGADIFAVVHSIVPEDYNSDPYKTTATTEVKLNIAIVAQNPGVRYTIKEDAVGGALAATNVGNVADLIGNGTGVARTGMSSNLIDSDTAAAGSSAQLRLLRKIPLIGNDIGDTSTLWEVVINEMQFPMGGANNGV